MAENNGTSVESEGKEQVQKVDVIYDWDEYFMSIACLAALRSEDKHSPVGACIVSPHKTVVGVGYNSMPNNDKGDFPWKGRGKLTFEQSRYAVKRKFLYVVHAAVNAIINKIIPDLEGCTIYITMPPGRDCAHAIIQSGIKVVKYGEFCNNQNDTDCREDIKDAKQLLRQSDILLIHFEMEKEPWIKREKDKVDICLSGRIRKETEEILCDDELFMAIAKLSAMKQGHHERAPECTQGACIVDENNRVLSVGRSGYPEIMNKKAIDTTQQKEPYYDGDPFIAHAEYKAILAKGTPSFRGCRLYVTKFPCHGCAQVIVQSGITKIKYDDGIPYSNPVQVERLVTKTSEITKGELVTTKEFFGRKREIIHESTERETKLTKMDNPVHEDEVNGTMPVITPIKEEELDPSKKGWKKQAKTNSYYASKEHILRGMDVKSSSYSIKVTLTSRRKSSSQTE